MTTDNLLRQLADQLPHYIQFISQQHQDSFQNLLNQINQELAPRSQPGPPNGPVSEAEAYLQAMFESIHDYAIFTLDLNGDITTWNTGAQRMFGYTEDEAIGRSGAIIFTPEDQAQGAVEQELGQALHLGRAEDERWHIRKDQSRFFASGVMHKLLDDQGEMRGFIKIARDETERRRAEAAQQEQRAFAKALHEIAITLTSTLNLDEVLDYILTTVDQVVPHDAAQILVVDQGAIVQIRSRGYSSADLNKLETFLAQHKVDDIPLLRQVQETGRAVILKDALQEQQPIHLTPNRSYVVAPIIAIGHNLGFLTLASSQAQTFTEKHSTRLEAFAAQAAIALHNAQLYLQAQELSALTERQRLARDLHDTVTQNLFTASTLTEVIPRQWQVDPEKARNSFALLNTILKGALAEMRVLLLQMRPEKLLDARLHILLRQLVESIQGHKDIAITLVIDDEPELPPEVHLAFYRIAQEALNNIAKHSRATQALIRLYIEDRQVKMQVRDNGRGFQTDKKAMGMGLQIMRERAEAIGGNLQIASPAEGGAEIILSWDTIRQA